MSVPFKPEDAEGAYNFINRLLRSRDERPWTTLFSDDYALLTERVLTQMKDTNDTAFSARNGDLEVARQRRVAGTLSQAEWAEKLAEYEEWKLRAQHFQDLVMVRLRAVKDIGRRLRGFTMAAEVTEVLLKLAAAVAEHRDRVDAEYEPTEEDRMLWLRLSLLRVPWERSHPTLEEALRERRAEG